MQYLSIDLIPKRVIDRFWERVDVRGSDECWEWTGPLIDGYGRLSWGSSWSGEKKWIRSHRLSALLKYSNLPPEILIRHLCNNSCCCNPAHLDIGTHQDNSDDWVLSKFGISLLKP